MTWSDDPCDICGNNDGFTQRERHNDVSVVLCQDCQTKYDDKLGYSHVVEEVRCPTCYHRRIKIRRYQSGDKGVHECEECHKFFSWTTTFNQRKLCEDCASKASKEERKWPERKCPECHRTLNYAQKTTIPGWVVGTWNCRCGFEDEPLKIKKVTPVRPKFVEVLA